MELYALAFAPQYTHLHSSGMEHDIPALLRAIKASTGVRQAELARRLETDQPQISRWLNGAKPEVSSYERIVGMAYDLGLLSDLRSEDVADALPAAASKPTVKLKGYVGAGSRAHFYALSDDDYAEVEAPPGATDKTVAVEIKGKSMGKALESWLVFYDDVRSPVAPEQINQLCVVGLADDRILIKIIERKANGRKGFRLLSNGDEPPIEDAKIEWAALVTNMARRR